MTITGEIETSGAGLEAGLPETSSGGIVRAAAVSTRHKRGKQMSRRKGQNPKLEVRNGMYTFRYRKDVPGVEDRKQVRGVIGSIKQMTKSEAERRIKEFMVEQQINTGAAKIPSVLTFADTVKHYRDVFAPRMLRASTFSVADGHLKRHLEADWNEVPVEHINIDTVNEWIWKKRKQGLSWTMIKNILRTMQRVLSCSSKDKKPPFSQEGLAIPEKDKLQMKIESRQAASFLWTDAKRIANAVKKLNGLDDSRKERYAMAFLLASATGLRCGELFALRVNDINFKASTIRVDESVDQRTYTIGPCKNAAAYRTVLLADREGKEALRMLRHFLGGIHNASEFVFHSRTGSPLRETNVLVDGLHPALKAVGLPQAGMHAFRHGCNRRWELAGVNPAIVRQHMGHSSAAMTARYTGEIPLEQVRVVTRCDQKQFGAVA
ncbi:MAG: site-specific integrase [Candidatus Acidiferrales bacterium]